MMDAQSRLEELMSYKLQAVSPSVYNVVRSRYLLGRITCPRQDGNWSGRVKRGGEVFTVTAGSPLAVFEELIRQMNRVSLGVDRHDSAGAHAAIAKRSQDAVDEAARRNAELDRLGVKEYRWGTRRRRRRVPL
jgi:hypothetical protein